jgi:hypothetical protein
MKEASFLSRNLVLLFSFMILADFVKEDQTSEKTKIPSQLLADPDAELISGQYWFSKYDSAGFTVNRTDDAYLSPTHSLKISKTVPDSLNSAYYVQIYSGQMPVGRNLTLQVHVKGLNLEGDGVSILLLCNDIDDSTVQFTGTEGDKSIAGTFDWTSYKLELIDLKSEVRKIYVFLFYLPNTTGTAYFDDITLTPDPLKISSPAKKKQQ